MDIEYRTHGCELKVKYAYLTYRYTVFPSLHQTRYTQTTGPHLTNKQTTILFFRWRLLFSDHKVVTAMLDVQWSEPQMEHDIKLRLQTTSRAPPNIQARTCTRGL